MMCILAFEMTSVVARGLWKTGKDREGGDVDGGRDDSTS
jgi:hypothetical protein